MGSDAYRFGGERLCHNTQVRTDRLEQAGWIEVCQLLDDPPRLAQEYTRRLEDASQPHRNDPDQALLDKQIVRLRQGIARLIDGYAEGYLDKDEFEPRIRGLKERLEKLEAQARQIADQAAWRGELQRVIGRLEEFSTRVKDGLAQLDWSGQRELIRTLVKRVEIDQTHVKVVFRVDAGPFDSGAGEIMQDCRRRDLGRQVVSLRHNAFRVPPGAAGGAKHRSGKSLI